MTIELSDRPTMHVINPPPHTYTPDPTGEAGVFVHAAEPRADHAGHGGAEADPGAHLGAARQGAQEVSCKAWAMCVNVEASSHHLTGRLIDQ